MSTPYSGYCPVCLRNLEGDPPVCLRCTGARQTKPSTWINESVAFYTSIILTICQILSALGVLGSFLGLAYIISMLASNDPGRPQGIPAWTLPLGAFLGVIYNTGMFLVFSRVKQMGEKRDS